MKASCSRAALAAGLATLAELEARELLARRLRAESHLPSKDIPRSAGADEGHRALDRRTLAGRRNLRREQARRLLAPLFRRLFEGMRHRRRAAEHDRGGAAHRGGGLERPGASGGERLDPFVERGVPVDRRLREAFGVMLRNGEQELFTRRKVLRDRAHGHPGPLGDLRRRRLDAPLVQEIRQRAHDGGSGSLGALASTVDLRWCDHGRPLRRALRCGFAPPSAPRPSHSAIPPSKPATFDVMRTCSGSSSFRCLAFPPPR